jgi:hypothetical protein
VGHGPHGIGRVQKSKVSNKDCPTACVEHNLAITHGLYCLSDLALYAFPVVLVEAPVMADCFYPEFG